MCTGILLKSQKNDVVRARTLEWSAFDFDTHLCIYPRKFEFNKTKSQNTTDYKWQAKYGFVAMIGAKDYNFAIDGINEKGLGIGAFYHPGYAEYDYKHQSSKKDISVSQLIAYLLSNCADIDQVRNELENNIHVISLIEPLFGTEVPAHYIASDKSGNSIIIEFLAKKTIITPNPIGVITNSPSFAWHMTNLRNYLQLHIEPAKSISIDGVELAPLSSGTGMLGLPGDFTSPSRFVRAIALSKAASKTDNGPDTVLQALHTLDNFNVPLSSAEGADINQDQSLKRATIWSSAGDLTSLKYYYHTATNRRTRMIDLKKIDFNSSELVILPIEKNKQDDIYEIEIHSAIQVIPF